MTNQNQLHVVKLGGALAVSGAPDVKARIIAGLDAADAVALDVSGAVEIDVSFLQILAAAKKTAAAERKDLTILSEGAELLTAQIDRCGLSRSDMPAFRPS